MQKLSANTAAGQLAAKRTFVVGEVAAPDSGQAPSELRCRPLRARRR